MHALQPGPSGWDLLHTVMGEFALPMAVMDSSRRLVHVSPALEHLADSRFEPMPSERIPSYFNLHDASGRRPVAASELTLVRACAGESVQHAYVTVKPPGGPARLLRCTAAPLRGAGFEVRGALLVATDASDEQPLSSLPRQLRRERFASVQHELRTPLTALLGYAEVLQELAPGLPEEAREPLARIAHAGERLKVVLDSLPGVFDGRSPVAHGPRPDEPEPDDS